MNSGFGATWKCISQPIHSPTERARGVQDSDVVSGKNRGVISPQTLRAGGYRRSSSVIPNHCVHTLKSSPQTLPFARIMSMTAPIGWA
jgi:hypothetical protein